MTIKNSVYFYWLATKTEHAQRRRAPVDFDQFAGKWIMKFWSNKSESRFGASCCSYIIIFIIFNAQNCVRTFRKDSQILHANIDFDQNIEVDSHLRIVVIQAIWVVIY